jgi:hypothetical protein
MSFCLLHLSKVADQVLELAMPYLPPDSLQFSVHEATQRQLRQHPPIESEYDVYHPQLSWRHRLSISVLTDCLKQQFSRTQFISSPRHPKWKRRHKRRKQRKLRWIPGSSMV